MKKILFFVVLSVMGFAHQFFPVQENGEYKVVFWADGHWGEYQVQNIFGIVAKDSAGMNQKVAFDYANNKIIATNPAMLAIHYDFGHYTFLSNGKHYAQRRDSLTDKEGGNKVTQTRKIYKIGKSIFQWNANFSKPIGLKLEIVPLQNPLELKEGDSLRLQVFFEGRPAQGLEFEDQIDDIENLYTDENGIIELKLRKPQDGLQIFGTSIKIRQLDKFADTLQITSTLSFKTK
ncbi:DUF4198 domain-containing protein [Helicobacter anatolicus]|uniref:DUF4198 domain-containing protein n=1 Tax=Helicobacter anatolicus TaxID=2905874 RepID=UPI001E53DEB0|nr:DUF4198 domain-containing protein [Helicobacter anatolicus]MCE3038681.1 DUF4198 domain-containing protein [Helicobacter anatolicus]